MSRRRASGSTHEFLAPWTQTSTSSLPKEEFLCPPFERFPLFMQRAPQCDNKEQGNNNKVACARLVGHARCHCMSLLSRNVTSMPRFWEMKKREISLKGEKVTPPFFSHPLETEVSPLCMMLRDACCPFIYYIKLYIADFFP